MRIDQLFRLFTTAAIFMFAVNAPLWSQNQPNPNESPPASLDDQRLDDLSDDLLDPVDPPPADEAQKDDTQKDDSQKLTDKETTAVQLIAEAMRRSEQLVAQHNSGEETKKVQQQIVDRLEEVIRQSRRQQRSKKPAGGSSKPQQKPLQGDKRPNRDTQPGAGDPNDNRPARESTERAGHNKNNLADIGRLRSLLDGPWGKLPEKERQAKIQGFRDHFLPQYEIEIERYYQRLLRQQEQSP